MLEQSLNGARGVWQFREAGQGEWMPAEAPGCNYGDLLALGKIPDPFIGQNEEKSKWVAERDWEYRRAFFVDQALLQMDEVFPLRDARYAVRSVCKRHSCRPGKEYAPEV